MIIKPIFGMGITSSETLIAENSALTSDTSLKIMEKFYEGSVTGNKQSQSFTVSSNVSLSKVKLKLFHSSPNYPPSGTLRVGIYAADAAHKPTGSVLAYAEIPAAITMTQSWKDFVFSPTLALTAGVYALVASAENIPLPPSPNSYSFSVGFTYTADRYTGGRHYKWTGSAWAIDANTTEDIMFQVWVS